MALYGIVDIKMRMLRIPELKRIMGFPEDYVLVGTQADQKKFIGNAVEVTQAKKNAEALCAKLRELRIEEIKRSSLMKEYIEFLKDKMAISRQTGFEVNPDELTLSLYPHVKDTVRWAISGGCRAIFSSFGMQKTVTQLEILRVVLKHKGGKGLIVCPKRVVVEFLTQAEQHLHMKVTYVRAMADVMICRLTSWLRTTSVCATVKMV